MSLSRSQKSRFPKALRDSMTIEQRAEFLLKDAENQAWVQLARGKYGQFGYWAAKTVQFRQLLGKTHEPAPFKALVDLARGTLSKEPDL